MTIQKQHQGKRPTAAAVAKLAGVSTTTVSFVLNKRVGSGIPKSTQESVLEAARQLGYRPNLVARSLASGQTNTMAFWITKLSAMVYFTWVEFMLQEVQSHGYDLIISERGKAAIGTAEEFRSAPEWPVDGLFAYGPWVSQYLELNQMHTPTVVIGPYPAEGIDYVGVTFRNAEIEAVEHLIYGGRKRIVGIYAPTMVPFQDEHLDAYREAMARAGLQEEVFQIPGVSRSNGYEGVKEYLESRSCPEAFVCRNDDVAIGVMRGLKEAGIRIPEDVAIVGSDGLEDTEYHEPPISTISIPFAEI
ncbi:MAG TPA: LacI family DNA-binding transcriptional regulator, partial [Armatimonadota bacterium]